MTFKLGFKLKVTRSDWLRNPSGRWSNALAYAGQAWQTALRNYPPEVPNEGFHGMAVRTMNLGKHADYRVTSNTRCDLIAPFYTAYLLLGTGVFGPRGAPFMVNATIGVADASHPLAPGPVFIRWSYGAKWEGKLEEIQRAIPEGFKEGLKRR
jgi:hypothetical protein